MKLTIKDISKMDDGTEKKGSYMPYLGVISFVYNKYWCELIWNFGKLHNIKNIGDIFYQFTSKCTQLSGDLNRILYNHAGGIIKR